MIVVGWLMTFVLPHGAFERSTDDDGRSRVVAGTYSVLDEPVTLGPQHVLSAIPRGFEAAGDIIFFVFIVGGAFGVLRVTGAVDHAPLGLLYDPQTAGGLLIALPPADAKKLEKDLRANHPQVAIVGDCTARGESSVVVR